MKFCKHLLYSILVAAICFANIPGMAFARGWELSFKGSASGGSLILASTLNRNVKYVSIQTYPVESPDSVTQRLADAINQLHSSQTSRAKYDPHWLWVGGFQARASGTSVILAGGCGDYVLAGTESGLGIPSPPVSLSCSCELEKGKVVLRWINAPGGYDYILIKGYEQGFGEMWTRRVPNTQSDFTVNIKRVPMDTSDMGFRIIGYRNGIPSNAATILVSNHGRCQGETYGIPFAAGIAPNWSAWSTAKETDKTAFEQGEKYIELKGYNPSATLSTKPFYQVVKGSAKGVTHGVYRKFLGLTPGHTYRLTACLSTLEMDSANSDWSFSINSAPSGRGAKDLTERQLAGQAALPDGRSGPEAAQICSFGPSRTTQGNFDFAITGYTKLKDGSTSSHITLPPDVNEITVWLRFSCSDPSGKVGFSGVKLEDITAMKEVPTPEQIIERERQAELELLRREEIALSRLLPLEEEIN